MLFRTTILAALLLAASPAFPQTPGSPQNIVVPGTANLWLAGAPNGTSAVRYDAAPAQSPVLLSGISGGFDYSFSVAGWVSNVANATSGPGPDGNLSRFTSHAYGAQNGISNLTAPLNSLIGVFTTEVPSSTPGTSLVFGTTSSLNFNSLTPTLNQAFFIGDGLTSTGQTQLFTAPTGAQHLYLGSMDAYEWRNNSGSFTVHVTAIPEPSTYAALIGVAALAVVAFRRWRR